MQLASLSTAQPWGMAVWTAGQALWDPWIPRSHLAQLLEGLEVSLLYLNVPQGAFALGLADRLNRGSGTAVSCRGLLTRTAALS